MTVSSSSSLPSAWKATGFGSLGANGTYEPNGTYNTYPYYRNKQTGWFLWLYGPMPGPELWALGNVLGGLPYAYTKFGILGVNFSPYNWVVGSGSPPGGSIITDESSSSVSSVSSLSSFSSSSNSSSQSSLYGYLDAPTNIRKTSLDFSTGKVKIEWDWENNPLATPQEPSGFILQKRIGSRDWETIEFYISGDAREYEDTLTRDELRLLIVGGESLAYKIRAYWHFYG